MLILSFLFASLVESDALRVMSCFEDTADICSKIMECTSLACALWVCILTKASIQMRGWQQLLYVCETSVQHHTVFRHFIPEQERKERSKKTIEFTNRYNDITAISETEQSLEKCSLKPQDAKTICSLLHMISCLINTHPSSLFVDITKQNETDQKEDPTYSHFIDEQYVVHVINKIVCFFNYFRSIDYSPLQIPPGAPKVARLNQWDQKIVTGDLSSWLIMVKDKFSFQNLTTFKSKHVILPKTIFKDMSWILNHHWLVPLIQKTAQLCTKPTSNPEAIAWIKQGLYIYFPFQFFFLHTHLFIQLSLYLEHPTFYHSNNKNQISL